MEFLPSFSAWPFAVAGLIAAVGPLVIHLLNRRRFRVVEWGAMDFLREAVERNRRILQMRDLILLLLRTAAVLLVGLALAQPFFSPSNETYDGSKPLHAVLVIDNSMSMGYESLEGTLLDLAKGRARQYLDKLPADSRVSVIPLCGSARGYSPDAYTKEDALEALDAIDSVDRSASVQRAINEAHKACETGPMLGKRVVFFSDQQLSNWRDLTSSDQFDDLPSLQVVEVSASEWQNTWISDLRIQDGVADIETPTTFIVELRHEGTSPRHDVQVALTVDDIEVASKTVSIEPGLGAREIAFEHLFNSYQPEPGQPVSVPVRASITPDRLPADDQRHLVVHVVAALPVVFVDQYGEEEENPVKRRLGETRHLRKLLSPVTSRKDSPRQLVKTRHIRLDQLNQSVLEDARLVVVAGIADPESKVPLLREYVEQGGRLMIAAGGDYDPNRWTDAAWLDGAGILPAPLLPDPTGATPDEAGEAVKPFFLSYESLSSHYYFQLAGVGEKELRDLYAEPFFFKAVQVDLSAECIEALHRAEMSRLAEEHRSLADAADRRRFSKLGTAGDLIAEEQTQLPDAEQRSRQLRPKWLLWSDQSSPVDEIELPEDPSERERRLSELAARTHPRVLARFDDPMQTPYLVERRIGRGTVLFVSSGLLSEWNTLPQTNTILIFDRILRSMVQSTLPQRNFPGRARITLPLPGGQRDITVALRRPGKDKDPEILDAGFIGREQLGFSIQNPLTRGLYRVAAYRPANGLNNDVEQTLWELPLTVNGDTTESELLTLSREQFQERTVNTAVGWVGPGEDISLAGAQIRGQDSWWWLIIVVLAVLFVELMILASSAMKTRGAEGGNGSS
ncbi:MAG: BatA domain-containing protein [Planctomycetes bacterium]|nr:BatA domain-containing protein [Planctomycetota bacterium]